MRQALAMGIDRTAIARALLGPLGIDPQPLGNHIFMANQNGYQDNSGDVGTVQSRRRRGSCSTRPDGRSTAPSGRRMASRSRSPCVIPAAVATSKQESELMQNMLAHIGVTLKINTVPIDGLLRQVHHAGAVRLHGLLVDRHAVSDQLGRSIYAKPTKNAKGELDIQQNYARVGTRRDRRALRPRPTRSSTARRPSRSPTAWMR